MVKFTSENIFLHKTEALVNVVSYIDNMQHGLASEFRRRFPDNYRAYKHKCQSSFLKPGEVFIFETKRLIPRFIINLSTKLHWRSKGKIEDIETGLYNLIQVIYEKRIRSISIPDLKVGLSKLSRNSVRPLVEQILGNLENVRVIVFERKG